MDFRRYAAGLPRTRYLTDSELARFLAAVDTFCRAATRAKYRMLLDRKSVV